MTAFQEYWLRAAQQFGLKVQIPFHVELDGERLVAPVLLEEFGAPRGMVLVTQYQDIALVSERLVDAGFGYSCLSESLGTDIDNEGLFEILRDWGWSGTGDAPSWYAA